MKPNDYLTIHQSRYKHILSQIKKLNLPKNSKILDVGCYPAHIFNQLQKLGYQSYGISSPHEPVDHPRVKTINIEKEPLGFKSIFFDLILFNEIIEHLPKSPILVLKKLKKVTKNGGYLIITTPNVANLANRLKLLFGKNIYYSVDRLKKNHGQGDNIYHRHNREYTLRELKDIVENAGWQIVKADYFTSYTPFRYKNDPVKQVFKLVYYYLTQLYPAWEDSLFVLAKKD